ncbi:MAG: hypothetical protein LBL21_03210 [Rickettsiales bacterium]|jgi:hypothetical protein|nr:hypothetical protein [Rickettsiales bacterium]
MRYWEREEQLKFHTRLFAKKLGISKNRAKDLIAEKKFTYLEKGILLDFSAKLIANSLGMKKDRIRQNTPVPDICPEIRGDIAYYLTRKLRLGPGDLNGFPIPRTIGDVYKMILARKYPPAVR